LKINWNEEVVAKLAVTHTTLRWTDIKKELKQDTSVPTEVRTENPQISQDALTVQLDCSVSGLKW